MSTQNVQNVCSLLTPTGRGAIAVVALRGPDSSAILNELFQPVSVCDFQDVADRDIVYGTWCTTNEDLVVCRRGSDHFEVQCHGGNAASNAIIKSLCSSSYPVCEVEACDIHDKNHSPWYLSTRAALTNAVTQKSATILLRQLDRLPDEVEQVIQELENGRPEAATKRIDAMLSWRSFGLHLTQPWSIVFCGEPNVGKSSLMNTIVGFGRAIVHDTPGTTRDVVTQRTAINGWPVELRDTAGIRDGSSEIEAAGIEKAKEQIEAADLVVALFDLTVPWSKDQVELIELASPDLIVHNKVDLVDSIPDDSRPGGIHVSAMTNAGVEELVAEIGIRIVPDLPGNDCVFPVTVEQAQRLETTLTLIQDGDSPKAVQVLREKY